MMPRCLIVLACLAHVAGHAHAHGLLIPTDKTVPPLAMLNHQVRVSIEDQVAVTRVEQTFRNSTDRQLEATYVFPVPTGASVNSFVMWVDGKEVGGELLEATKARSIYTEIVRRTQDPGLLEYMGNNLFRLRVFPVPPRGDQKVVLSFTSVSPRDAGVVEYVYPLKTSAHAVSTLEKFSLDVTLKCQQPVQTVYSPTHAISVTRPTDRDARVTFERDQAVLDKDFQLFYAVGDADVGLSALMQKPLSDEHGFFLAAITPRVEHSKSQVVPRDVVLVLDTSGSMAGIKMDQARRALKSCLSNLGANDRLGLINFSTTVNRYRDTLCDANPERVEHAKKWVDDLRAGGGTAIDDALTSALDMRTRDEGRGFVVVFFTDGQPTFGEINPERILKNAAAHNTSNTRIFTFGVGDDVNATMLDQLAEQTRAVSTYVRPAEDIEAKVSSLYGKISRPVLTALKLTAGNGISLSELYPPHLPDLFDGGQVVVIGRYQGHGPAALTLTGTVGSEPRTFVYDLTFPEKTTQDRSFVEHLWARRKVGYVLDEIRKHGEKKELVDEVVALATKYGIATPYTSYLIVPDNSRPGQGAPLADRPHTRGFGAADRPASAAGAAPALQPAAPGAKPTPVREFAKKSQEKDRGGLAGNRDRFADKELRKADAQDVAGETELKARREKKAALDDARAALAGRQLGRVQSGKLGVDLSVQSNNLRNQAQVEPTARRLVYGRNCLEIGGVWIDEGYTDQMNLTVVKAQSDAYFRILDRQPRMKDVFQLGNHLLWVTHNGTALVVDTGEGNESMTDAEIDSLFVRK